MSERPTSPTTKQRQHPRRRVSWSVHWSDGRRARVGEIRDISEGGVFLAPSWAPSDAIRAGDTVDVQCRKGDKTFEFSGKVRWSGNSAAHGVQGLGIQVDADMLGKLADVSDDEEDADAEPESSAA